MKKRTKIIATIGPASCSPSMINRMIVGGTDVFRINLSHSTIDDAKKILSILTVSYTHLTLPTTLVV